MGPHLTNRLTPVVTRSYRERVTTVLARLIAIMAVVVCLTGVGLALLAERPMVDELVGTPEPMIALSFPIVGALLVGHREGRRIGWVLIAIGASAALFVGPAAYVGFRLGGDTATTPPPGAAELPALAWLASWAWLPTYLLILAVLPHLLPDGRVVGWRWAPIVASVVLLAVTGVGLATDPEGQDMFAGLPTPFASTEVHEMLEPVVTLLDPLVVVLALVGLASVLLRLRDTDRVVRRQVGWVAYSVTLAVLLIVVGEALDAPGWMSAFAVCLIPGGIAVAVLRFHLMDLDLVVNRTLVAGLLVALASLAYAAVVGWLGALLDSRGDIVSFAAAFVVALVFHPARMYVQRQVDRLFFGRRRDPYALASDLDRTFQAADSPREVLGSAAEVIRRGLRLSGTEIAVALPSGEELRARAAAPLEPIASFPLVVHGEHVGVLLAGSRRGSAMSGTDLRILGMLSGQVASAAYAVRLSGDLAESHISLIRTREDERRRLRRDLHDGLGPQLAGVVMGLDSVRTALARGNVERADDLTRRAGEHARAAIHDVRTLVAGLRPSILDDLGLAGALASSGPAATESGPDIVVTTEGDLSDLPAAVELAAFRIASEAVTNAVRHARATEVDVHLAQNDHALTVRVRDDGTGLRPGAQRGVGLHSMHERATELGGWCHVGPAPGVGPAHGTEVEAHLPWSRP